ncbi:hypothetical protein SUDANB176_00353 [Streptomyces sp. enrichment culture]
MLVPVRNPHPPVQQDRPDLSGPRWAGGRPRPLTPDDEDFVVQTATARPTKLGQPFTRWSIRELAARRRPTAAPTASPTSAAAAPWATTICGGVNRRRRGTADSLAAPKSIRADRPDGTPIHILLDDLSAHTGAGVRRWAKKNKVESCSTQACASWANPIEAHFGWGGRPLTTAA